MGPAPIAGNFDAAVAAIRGIPVLHGRQSAMALGGGLNDILVPVAVLLAMGAILFVIAVSIINRRGLAQA